MMMLAATISLLHVFTNFNLENEIIDFIVNCSILQLPRSNSFNDSRLAV